MRFKVDPFPCPNAALLNANASVHFFLSSINPKTCKSVNVVLYLVEGSGVVHTQLLHQGYPSYHHTLFSIHHYKKFLPFLHMNQCRLPA